MKLLKLIIKNFKGIKDFSFRPEGQNAYIFGQNGAGKTTINDAFSWLLFGKDSQNKSNFEIKCLDENGEPVHNIEHSVEAELLLEDGSTVIIGKVYKEIWTKKRGSTKAEHTGHTTDHSIDGVPVQQKEYKAKIDSLGLDEETFRLLTSPIYFCETMHWKDRRSVVLEVAGDVTDDEVITSNKKLKKLPGILNGKSIDDYRKIIASKRKKINEELEHIPTRIDEVTRGLPDVTGLDLKEIQSEIQDLTGRYQSYQDEIKAIESGDTAEIKQSIRELQAELQEGVIAHKTKVNQALNNIADSIRKTRKELMTAESERDNLTTRHESHLKKIKVLQQEMDELRKDFAYQKSKTLTHEDTCTCPTCGQDIPEDTVVEARDKALKEFNMIKSDTLKHIQTQGKQKKEQVEQLHAEVNEMIAKNEPLTKKILELEDLLAKQRNMEKQMEQDKESIGESEDYQSLSAQIQDLKDQLEEKQETLQARVQDKTEELEKIKEALDRENQKINALNQHEAAQARIKELEGEEQQLAVEYEKLEEELYLTEEFIRTKVKSLEDKINSKFELVKFKLFETQVNGGITETCEATYKGVPYGSNLNHGAKVNVGLDIIRTLSEHYGVKAPIFIDNRESVTELIDMPSQLINLVVSVEDKGLRIEIEKEPNTIKEAV